MRGKGTYEKIIRGIKTVLKHKIPLRLHAVLTKYTMNSLKDMVRLCQKFNLKFNFAECSLPGIENRDSNLVLSDEDLEKFYSKYKEYKKKTKTVASLMTAINYILNWPLKGQRTIYKKDVANLKPGSYIPCQLGQRSCMIDVDGKVYSCPERWKEGLNLFDVGFDKAWNRLQKKTALPAESWAVPNKV
jgi:MoaA/NifB/PqqE/SkfB family radical SAM enzyme